MSGSLGSLYALINTLRTAFEEQTRSRARTETVARIWPDGGRLTAVAEAAPDEPVRVVYRTGTLRPDTGADVLVMAPGGDMDDHASLNRVRREGIAVVKDEEMTELAIPVCDDGVRPTATRIGGIPRHRSSPETVDDLGHHLRILAARLTHRLGAAVYQLYGWSGIERVCPAQDLDDDQLDELLRGLWGARLAYIRTDGTPHMVPLWYEWDGEVIWLAASPGASWRSYVARNSRVSVTMEEPWPPLRRVFLGGEVPGGLGGLRRRLALCYLGRGAVQSPALQETAGWAATRILPDRIHGRHGLGTTAA